METTNDRGPGRFLRRRMESMRDRGPGRLLFRARREGRRAGRSGKIDQWLIADRDRVPYLNRLTAEMNGRLAELRAGRVQAVEKLRRGAAERRGAADVAAHGVAATERDIAGVQRFMDSSLARMDRLAVHEAKVRDRTRTRDDTGRPPDMPPDMELDDLATPAHTELTGESARGQDPARWEGPMGKGLPAWLRYGLIAMLIGIEVPVQLQIFLHFDDDVRLTMPFAASVSVIMAVLPHLSGRIYRARHQTGAERGSGPVALVLLVPWAVLACLFGDLRRRVLFPSADAEGTDGDDGWTLPDDQGVAPLLIDRLGLDWFTVSVMFAALLLLSGAVAFLLGISEDHPAVSAYRGAAERQNALERSLRQGRAAADEAKRTATELEGRVTAIKEGFAHKEERTRAHYQAAGSAYLDEAAHVLRDPSVTEAAGRATGPLPGDDPKVKV
ncbi:hypothetical protein GCM10009677_02070 [Sphaerisporangium rubeum]|uniref:Uncharacterized protein n=1 Tax=Sphaerisporangium rubeum TaxID=321317 RepID=A0A7X0IFR3_9ACTN|nr:hypothetical protein [Sphaerisporangium rubeum]MBB6473158.1 hypothetical protein [Sphaerisporangium rubeum]